jgi:hypothetical protein
MTEQLVLVWVVALDDFALVLDLNSGCSCLII